MSDNEDGKVFSNLDNILSCDLNYVNENKLRINYPPCSHLNLSQNIASKRSVREKKASSLPNIWGTNHRSLWPRLNNTLDELLELNAHVGFHTEIWEIRGDIQQRSRIDKAYELKGVSYFSSPRENRIGGGTAITLLNQSSFTMTQIFPPNPKNVEVCWCILKIKNPTSHIKSILLCCFYSPPNSRKQSSLIDHISEVYHKNKTSTNGFVCAGDRNDIKVESFLKISDCFRQIVTKPTYGDRKILDICVTDLGSLYCEPQVRQPIIPEDSSRVPSDHNPWFVKPRNDFSNSTDRQVICRTVRPLTNESKNRIGTWLQSESWEHVYDGRSSSEMASRFHSLLTYQIDLLCPTKEIKISALNNGKPIFPSVQKLARRKKRIYAKKGNCQEYKNLKKALKLKLKEEGAKYIEKQCELANSNKGSWHKKVGKLFKRPGDEEDVNLCLQSHIDLGLSNLESAERINAFFSSISQEYKHLEIEDLPERVKIKLTSEPCSHPIIQDFEVYEDMKKAKKTASTPLDIPVNILSEFLPELVTPVAAIYRQAIESHEWPQCYKQERHLPIKKKQEAITEDDIRTLGLTAFFSKRLEAFLIRWIWPYILPHLSHDQMGGIPGSSVVHYLTKMLHWILEKLDNNNEPTAVLASLIDFSKGFNRMSPVILITLLSDLNIPTCALRLIFSYLSNRSMVTTFNGAVSSPQHLCGGGPQGSLLIVLLFCLQVNGAGNPCPRKNYSVEVDAGFYGPNQEPTFLDEDAKLCHQTEKTDKKIYIDDLTELEAINLKASLVPSDPNFIGPLNYHERCGLVLPAHLSILQHKLSDIHEYTRENMMMVNRKKTMVIPFNFTKKYDFIPQLTFPGEQEPLDVIYETKLLGVTISSDLSFARHVTNISAAASRTLWLLVRFRDMGANRSQLVTLWQQKGRSILEYASPVFFSRLTQQQSKQLEDVQRKAFAIILKSDYVSYENALEVLHQEKLSDRRLNAALKFGEKCVASLRHRDMFPRNQPGTDKRRAPKPFKEYFCRTDRFYSSSLPTIVRLLNEKYMKRQ